MDLCGRPADESGMPTPTILLVDDEPQITYLVARKLRQAGFEVVIGTDGEQGIDLALEHDVAMVISDLQMPYMSGLDMACALREHVETAQIPIVMLTARGYVMEAEKLERARISRVYPKPFSVSELLDCVHEHLGTQNQSTGREAA